MQNNILARNLGKNGNTWLIEVINYTRVPQTFWYNSRMCLQKDAENWTNLKDERSVYIENGKSAILEISENSMATHIAISYKAGIYRYIFTGTV